MQPYYEELGVTLYHGDCREIMPALQQSIAVTVADPPYGITSLEWDRTVAGWATAVPSTQLWCFGSLRFFLEAGRLFQSWRLAQDIVWQKHNGSNFHADRFRRIHELIAHFYRGNWSNIYRSVVTTPDATKRTVRAKGRPPHMGDIDRTPYVSSDGGPRLQRSIIAARSCHGYAIHPTQKPVDILLPLIEYSCPVDGVVLDPFAGSGSTLLAAHALGRQAIGIEISEEYCELAADRLRKELRAAA